MPMIFPGMDPWLEDPPLWPDVHESLIVYFREQLQPFLRPRYVAAIERRQRFSPARHIGSRSTCCAGGSMPWRCRSG